MLFTKLYQLAVHPGPYKALAHQVFKQVLMLAALAAHHGGQHADDLVIRHAMFNVAQNLIARLGHDRVAAVRAVPLAHSCIKHTQVIADLGDRADCRSRVPPRRLLLDGDGRAQALDLVHVRLGQLPQKLAGIAGKALDITPLTFCKKRVKRQRAFARAGDARHADQPTPGQVHIHPAQVVFPRAANADQR